MSARSSRSVLPPKSAIMSISAADVPDYPDRLPRAALGSEWRSAILRGLPRRLTGTGLRLARLRNPIRRAWTWSVRSTMTSFRRRGPRTAARSCSSSTTPLTVCVSSSTTTSKRCCASVESPSRTRSSILPSSRRAIHVLLTCERRPSEGRTPSRIVASTISGSRNIPSSRGLSRPLLSNSRPAPRDSPRSSSAASSGSQAELSDPCDNIPIFCRIRQIREEFGVTCRRGRHPLLGPSGYPKLLVPAEQPVRYRTTLRRGREGLAPNSTKVVVQHVDELACRLTGYAVDSIALELATLLKLVI
jgi:hypothetical protein